nr:spore germination protein [Alicyclobacillus sp. SO9]
MTTYNSAMLPAQLMRSIATARELSPFPTVIETTLMEFIFDGLQEAGIRLPGQMGPIISIVGAHLAPRCTNAWITYIKSISILDFIQSIDAFSAFVWTFSNTIAISTFVTITAFACILFSLHLTHFTSIIRDTIFVNCVLPLNMIGIPLILFVAEKWKRRPAV